MTIPPRGPAAGPALDGFVAVFGHLSQAIHLYWGPALEGDDAEALHDLRVAVRRTRSVLRQGKGVLPAEVRSRFRSEFKWLAGVTGEGRDLDVFLLGWDTAVDGLDVDSQAFEPVLNSLEQRRAVTKKEQTSRLQSTRASVLLEGWSAWLDDPRGAGGALGPDADRALGDVVADRLTDSWRRVLRRGRALHSTSPSSDLHALRKDAKELRYILTCFGVVLPRPPRKLVVKVLKRLQDQLGAHQDAEVQSRLLEDALSDLRAGERSRESMRAGKLLKSRFEKRHAASHKRARKAFAALDDPAIASAFEELLAGGPGSS